MLGYDSIIEPGTDPLAHPAADPEMALTLVTPESDPDSEANSGATLFEINQS